MGVLATPSSAKSGAYYPSSSPRSTCSCGCDCEDTYSTVGSFGSTQKLPKVSLFNKVKLLKSLRHKLQRRSLFSPKYSAPLLFHPVHGDHIALSSDGTRARRVESYRKAITFSHRPVAPKEKVYLRFNTVEQNRWSGVARVGFTTEDPSNLENRLPDYAIPDLTLREGFWMKELGEKYVKQGQTLYFYYNSKGDVYCGVGEVEKRLFYATVDPTRPLWMCMDVYGKTTAVELVNPRNLLNNSNASVAYTEGPSRSPSLATVNSNEDPFRALKRSHSNRPLPPIPSLDWNTNLCLSCADKPADTVIVPCAHQCLCHDCATRYCKTQKSDIYCPICKVTVSDILWERKKQNI